MIRLVCVDEVHLFVDFGTSFRNDFLKLKRNLFYELREKKPTKIDNVSLRVPLLYMTATFNPTLVTELETMTGIHVKRENYFWSSMDGFSRRNIKISLSSGAQPFKTTKEKLKKYLAGNVSKKGIVYSNTASGAAKAKKVLDTWLDMDRAFDGDVISIVGKQHFKLKVAKVTSFTKAVNADELIKKISFILEYLLQHQSVLELV